MTMEAGKWYQIGNPFATLETKEKYMLSEILSSGFSDGDLLFIMDPVTCIYPTIRKWQTVGTDTGWGNLLIPLIKGQDVEVKPGQGFLIHKKQKSTVTVSGMVNGEATSELQGNRAWNLVTVQYPTSTTINTIQWTGMDAGDLLFIMDPETGIYPTIRKWQTVGEETGWGNLLVPLIKGQDVTLTPGQAMLILKQGSTAGTVSFN